MESGLMFIQSLLVDTARTVVQSVVHNAIPLVLAIVMAVAMKVYVDTERLQAYLVRRRTVPVFAGVAVGAVTPLCACGTMSVVLGLLTTTLPWAPIMAFLTSSPLMSPDGFIMIAGIVSVQFAAVLAFSSVIIGLVSGFVTGWLERHTRFLRNQSRFASVSGVRPGNVKEPCGCNGSNVEMQASCGCSRSFMGKWKLDKVGEELVKTGVKQILLFFMLFVAIGYIINRFIPESIIIALFSSDTPFSVPLAALIGLPLYVSGDAAVPLINSLLSAGAGGGAMLAFMITGPATSAWVIAGVSAFMKRRALVLYVSFILVGGIVLGYGYDVLLRTVL